ncbi:MAG TPA: UvrD-helicase domain-containing protein [Cyclobacteriaceae bacterium]|nr:UvrD-helicase domain-containing protein [Cyclobacteriaceae bacterium]
MHSLKTFTLYRSSAGSGKTRTLAKEYLKLALRNKASYFRHILAVTFANKATQEMKDRILLYLDIFIKGTPDALADELKQELKMDEQTFRQNATELRAEILHQYDQFSISTIDAFFQKVIRAFTRESGLMGDYRLEVDQDTVLEEVINELIDELGENKELTKWVVEFAKENLENDRAWDVRTSLVEFAREIFREEFKAIEKEVREGSADPQFFARLKDKFWKVKGAFVDSVSKPAREALRVIEAGRWTDFDFSYGKGSTIFTFFNAFGDGGSLSAMNFEWNRIRNHFAFAKNWPSKNTMKREAIIAAADATLIPAIRQILEVFDRDFRKALSAEVALKNMYVFGLLSDIARKLQDYKSEHNLMLLADAPKFLNGIIQDSDTPFIYEKIGSFYRNYLIDEFQDTSGFQWKNFLPLLTNGLDQGYKSLVVGDVKQAIYRWRGGDLTLLQEQVEHAIGKERVQIEELDKNFRSAKNIVKFNNALFKMAATIVAADTGSLLAAAAYNDVTQQESKEHDGFVKIDFFPDEQDGKKWKDVSMEMIPHHLEKLQQQGVPLSDIAILVRYNGEGYEVASYLMEYKNSGKALDSCRYDVVSNESLRMEGAASVNLLLGALRYLLNPDDPIARAQLSYEYAKFHEPNRNNVEVFAVTNQVVFESQLPDRFTKEKISLKKLPLYELTETLIEIFRLGKVEGELAYIIGFQDQVLEFYHRERNDIAAFLEWWDDHKDNEKTSIKISGEVDAVKILTVHKAKGLQFKYVLVPFCAWQVDHSPTNAPNLWVTSDEEPFAGAGLLPVQYASSLDSTFFQEAYRRERTAVFLDNLNLLYVALSRAETGLIITSAVKSRFKTVGKWLSEAISQDDFLKTHFDNTALTFRLGDWNKAAKAGKEIATPSVALKSYASSRWRDTLVIRQSGTSFFQELESEAREKIKYGIHLHAVLSRIKYAGDVPKTTERLVREGMILQEDVPELRQQLEVLMSHPVIGRWFETDWDVRTEVPILLPAGDENRIDRLLLKDSKAIVIDFKTGVKIKADQKQVQAYMEILRKMGFKDVEGFLLYTRDQEVIAVGEDSQKIVKKKKNENQLGLDF